MPFASAPPNTAIKDGDIVTLRLTPCDNKDSEREFWIGSEEGRKEASGNLPEACGPGWANQLKGKRVGEHLDLYAPEGNIVPCTVLNIRR
jgi:hypothetical protein